MTPRRRVVARADLPWAVLPLLGDGEAHHAPPRVGRAEDIVDLPDGLWPMVRREAVSGATRAL
eukprot:4693313-Prymnesium_polylepis.1